MTVASFRVDPADRIAPVNRRIFGSFIEHMGRCVYTGVFERGHASADEDGFREDVLELVRELGVSTIRYPGGNFVSSYRWEDGIGDVALRPRRLDLAWRSIETNEFGMHEFMRWCKKAGVEPMYAVNLGTRGVQEALDVLEYANIPSGTAISDQRVIDGAREPFAIKMWCLGNEMDGPWQTGHKTATEYGRLAAETARAMRQIDPTLELVACGSSGPDMATFGEWERQVLLESYEQVDFISCHAYYEEIDGDLGSFLASAFHLDRYITSVIATADHVGATLKQTKKIMLSVDEWNVWYSSRGNPIEESPDGFPIAPRIVEETYNVADAVVVGDLLITLLRHSDRVTSASLAQLVNVLGPIRTEPAGASWRQTIFYPFSLMSRYSSGEVLRIRVDSSSYETNRYGTQPLVDAVATHDAADGSTSIFFVNRSVEGPIDATIQVSNGSRIIEAVGVFDDDPYAANTEAEPTRVIPRELEGVSFIEGRLSVSLPAVSWSMIRLAAPTSKESGSE